MEKYQIELIDHDVMHAYICSDCGKKYYSCDDDCCFNEDIGIRYALLQRGMVCGLA